MASPEKRDTRTRSLFAAQPGQRAQPVPFVPGPNPDLPKFIADHSTPYDPKTDKYDVPAFDRDIVVGKSDYLYNLHSYWSKKSPLSIKEYVNHYVPKGGLVLDPFCGSGTTGLGSSLAGSHAVLIDISPAAGFLAYHYNLFSSPEDVDMAFELIHECMVQAEDSYNTTCDRCGGRAITEFVIWSDTYQCRNCGEHVALGLCPKVKLSASEATGLTGGSQTKNVCPVCYEKTRQGRPEFVISPRSQRKGSIPIAANYTCLNGCKPKRATRGPNSTSAKARKAFNDIDLREATKPRPRTGEEIWGVDIPREKLYVSNRLDTRKIFVAGDLYSQRNRFVLSKVIVKLREQRIEGFSPLLFFTGLTHKISQLMACNSDGVGRVTKGTYYIAPIRMEARPSKYLSEAHGDVRRHFEAKASLHGKLGASVVTVERGASAIAKHFMDNSVDFIFTDPPYAGKAQYGELNFLWELWLGLDRRWVKDEVVINPYRNLSADDWDIRLRHVLKECYRVLKPNHWAAICFHDTDQDSWVRVQNAILDIGFELATVTVLDPKQKSLKQITTEQVVKSDLVLNCRKPKSGQLEMAMRDGEIPAPIKDRVRTILENALIEHPGLTRDKLFDIVTRRLLERAQMVEFRFEEVLGEIATKAEGDRWYLKAELEQLSKNDLANEETAGAALTRFTQLRSVGTPAKYAAEIALNHLKLCETNSKGELDEKAIEDWINDHLAKEDRELLVKKKIKRLELGGALAGIEFYDALFFYFTKYMKGKKAGQLPKRNLVEFLEEYLIHFQDGDKWLYRAPEGREAEELRKARQSGLGRRIRAFANALRDNDREYVEQHRPDVRTFVEWMRYCATFGRNEDGAALFDKGGIAVHELKSVMVDEEEEETAYDAVSGFAALCKRRLGPTVEGVEAEDVDTGNEEDS
ncbi:MAG: hypothetical protein HY360_00930 [Verrucomicrobia bacterium]|nr:hypothetical protein [Verrucomicrobiota bacterium]